MRRSDEERFTAFVQAHSATLFRTAYLMTGDYQRAEDILQSALVRVYQRWNRVEVMDRPVGYARKVVINQTISWWRGRSSRESPTALPAEPSWSGGVEGIAERERVWRAVLSLPPVRER
ncbi:MAG: sigma factor [Dermatophilaceae bacterium]